MAIGEFLKDWGFEENVQGSLVSLRTFMAQGHSRAPLLVEFFMRNLSCDEDCPRNSGIRRKLVGKIWV